MELRENKRHKVSLKGYIKGFSYAKDGLKSAYKNEQSMTLHFFTTIIIVTLCIILKATPIEWAVSYFIIRINCWNGID